MLNGIMTGRGTTRFVSLNVKRLNGPIKRARVFAPKKKLKAEIIYIYK